MSVLSHPETYQLSPPARQALAAPHKPEHIAPWSTSHSLCAGSARVILLARVATERLLFSCNCNLLTFYAVRHYFRSPYHRILRELQGLRDPDAFDRSICSKKVIVVDAGATYGLVGAVLQRKRMPQGVLLDKKKASGKLKTLPRLSAGCTPSAPAFM